MKCLCIYAPRMGSLISVMLIFPRRQCLSFPNEAAFQPLSCVAYPFRAFQQVFAKRAGISRPDECCSMARRHRGI